MTESGSLQDAKPEEPESQEPKSMDPKQVASVRRRLGFVALLWWIAAGSGTLGLLQGLHAGWVRLLFIGISWVLAIFFTYAWRHVPKAGLPQ